MSSMSFGDHFQIEQPQILVETENYLIIFKPRAWQVHRAAQDIQKVRQNEYSDTKTLEKSAKNKYFLTDWLLENYPELEQVGESIVLQNEQTIARPGIVHRLDRETSGLMIIPRNQESFLYYKDCFKNRTIQKKYLALCHGRFKQKRGIVDRAIARHARDFRKFSTQKSSRGTWREAQTEYLVSKTSLENCPALSLVELRPKTGRTHQLRVHCQAVGYPIVGDSLYGLNQRDQDLLTQLQENKNIEADKNANSELVFLNDIKKLPMFLHAAELQFTDQNGVEQKYSAPEPSYFTQTISGFF